MDELDFPELVLIKKHLDGAIKNTPLFDWSKITDILEILKKHIPRTHIIGFILIELKNRFTNDVEPYILLQALIILEIFTDKYKPIRIELSSNDIQDVLTHLMKTSRYENIRKKILILFHNWLNGCRKIPQGPLLLKLESELKKFSSKDIIKGKDLSEGFCFKCKKRRSNIICAACVQLMCYKCSLKTVALPQFGFRNEVKICDDCVFCQNTQKNENTAETPEQSHQTNEETMKADPNPESSADENEEPSETRSTNDATANAALIKSMECPVCLDIMKKPIIQCVSGHSMCQTCTMKDVPCCPICRAAITSTRNYIAEDLLENQKINCVFTSKGCNAIVKLQEKTSHQAECKFREFQCESKKFCKSSCNWTGSFNEIEQHFSEIHKRIIRTHHKTTATLKINFNRDVYDIQLVNFRDGKEFFWFKYKVDTNKQNVYWLVQLIGPKEVADLYCYEIMVSVYVSNARFTEICVNGTLDAEESFESGKCVIVPFKLLKKYVDEKNAFHCTLSILNIVDLPH